MHSLTCPICDGDFELAEHPFGSDVTCPHCGVLLETGFEVHNTDDGEDITEPWIEGVSDRNKPGETI